MRMFSLLVCLSLIHCGRNEGSGKKNEEKFSSSSSFTAASVGSLPTCDSKMAGALAYVKDERKFYTCEETWTVIDIKGDKGDTGPQGEAGTSANATKVTATTACSKIVSPRNYGYLVTTMSSGDLFVSCSVMDNSAGYSNSFFYSVSSGGANTGGCQVVYDLDSPYASGYFRFTKSGGTFSFTYNESGHSSNGVTTNFQASDCTTTTY